MNISFFDNSKTTTNAEVEPKTSAMIIHQETVTPEIAKQILLGNRDNRPANNRHVKFLADQMAAGAWKVTGDAIKISVSGRLLDGQHRLLAIIESGTTQNIYVARDCEEEIFAVLDTGRKRTAGDVLSTAGLKNASNLAAAARLLIMHRQGVLSTMGNKKKTASNAEVLAFVQMHDLDESVTKALTWLARCKLLNSSEWSALYYLFSQVDRQQAYSFMQQISTGLELTEGHPVFVLRTKLQQARDGIRYRYTAAERMALTVKAWNAVREGRKVSQLAWKSDQEFPEIV